LAERQPFTNRMARTGAEGETSYLSRAARQPVDWQPWDREAFALAAKLDRPILLYVGSDDCRSCDEGDRTIYTDPQIASLINAQFVPVRVDREERPDIARRYQAAVERMAGLRGWPLTVFLTADGSPFFGGTFFPADDPVTGRGLKQILPEVARRYRDQRPALMQQAALVRRLALADRDTRGVLRASMVREHIEGLMHELDRATRAGPAVASVMTAEAASLLLTEYTRAHDTLALRVAERALDGMLDSAAVGSDEDDPRLVRAALAGALAKAWVATGDARYREYGRAMAQQLARDAPSPRFADREAFIMERLMLAGATLGEPKIVLRARARFDVLLRHAYAKGWGVRHTFTSAVSPGAGIGLLQDQVQVASACLAARQLTGDRRYLEVARDLAAIMDRDYADSTGGYDDAAFASPAIPGVVNDRTKEVFDDALPGANAVAASMLARLAAMTGDRAYRRRAQATLDAFAGAIRGAAAHDLRATTYLGAAREVVGAQ
jgi:uncharacterized protein YyaL (SSP411 family)